jgi:trans-aconitate methyltransferase
MADLTVRIPDNLTERYNTLRDRLKTEAGVSEIKHPAFIRVLLQVAEAHYPETLELARRVRLWNRL